MLHLKVFSCKFCILVLFVVVYHGRILDSVTSDFMFLCTKMYQPNGDCVYLLVFSIKNSVLYTEDGYLEHVNEKFQ